MIDSTERRPSRRVVWYRLAVRQLHESPTSKAHQRRTAEAEKQLTANDWKWVRGEWHS